jgi:hypothetical protein
MRRQFTIRDYVGANTQGHCWPVYQECEPLDVTILDPIRDGYAAVIGSLGVTAFSIGPGADRDKLNLLSAGLTGRACDTKQRAAKPAELACDAVEGRGR